MLKNLCASVHEMKTKRDIMQGHLSNAELMKLQNANGCSVTMHKCKQLFVSYITFGIYLVLSIQGCL